jgi:hypothetical protein
VGYQAQRKRQDFITRNVVAIIISKMDEMNNVANTLTRIASQFKKIRSFEFMENQSIL